jgi:hypothetical protein
MMQFRDFIVIVIIVIHIVRMSIRKIGVENPSEVTNVRKLSSTLSRQSSVTTNFADYGTQLEDDTFEHILQETAHQDTVMAFYYMDENNKVEFFVSLYVLGPWTRP